MKKHYFCLLFFILFSTLQAQIVPIPNAVFKTKLLQASSSNFIAIDVNGNYFDIDANNNNEIEVSEATQVAYLNVSNANIPSLNGIDYFTNLVSLNCENNLISNLNVTALVNLTYLDCSNNSLNFLNINGLTELAYLNCESNLLNNLNANGITNLNTIDCRYNTITNLNLNNLINLENLNCSNNSILSLDLSDLVSIKQIDCSSNMISTLNVSNLLGLQELNCGYNQISMLTALNLNNLASLFCNNNQLSVLNLNDFSNLITLDCSNNLLTSVYLFNLSNLKNLNCINNSLSLLSLDGVLLLENLYCQNNQISNLELNGLTQLQILNCDYNELSSIDISSLLSLKYLYCNNNLLNSLSLTGLNFLQAVSCSNNSISVLNTSNLSFLQSLYCSNNKLVTLDLSEAVNLQNLLCNANLLTQIYIKNGSNESNLDLSSNPTLQYICADEFDLEYLENEILNNGYNCTVNSYCSFVLGGNYYTINGTSKYDSNSNGCNSSDANFSNLKLSIFNGLATDNLIASTTGNYSKSVENGSYTITPILENPSYFIVSPNSYNVNFPQNSTPFNQDFCIAPNGLHTDLEVTIIPLSSIIPGTTANFKIIYKNKGTVTQSGIIDFNFNTNYASFSNSNPVVTAQNGGNINWAFTNLSPLETRSIVLQLAISSSSVSIGQILNFNGQISSLNSDEYPLDNTASLNKIVVNNPEAYTKTCHEGNTISISSVGNYVHYTIRFKNTGTSIAQNIVVQDIIDSSKYDVFSLITIDASHLFFTKISENSAVEFIFENINLSNIANNNECYITFKIKTLPSLTVGDTFTNTANIYFDYNAANTTNTSATSIEALSNNQVAQNNNFYVYPNPVDAILNIGSKNNVIISEIEIYNSIGQLVMIINNPITNSIDVSKLKVGVYFMNVKNENNSSSIKFIKQ